MAKAKKKAYVEAPKYDDLDAATKDYVHHIAAVCHEANRAYCATLGDTSQVAFSAAPEWQRNSAIAGVLFVLYNPEAPASANHEEWLRVKEADGWTYGEQKDAVNKTHPCFVPYEELPDAQKRKDHLFRAVVNALK